MTNEELAAAYGECKGNLHYYIKLAHKREKRIEELIREKVDLEMELEELKEDIENGNI